jgi:hypothetical protein
LYAPRQQPEQVLIMAGPVPDDRPVLAELFDYWSGIRGDRRMPRRSDIDPAQFPKLLPHVMLVDIDADVEDLRFRLAGAAICKRFGKELGGRYWSDLDCGAGGEAILSSFRETADRGEPGYRTFDFTTPDFRLLRFAQVLLPLSDDGEHCNVILAGIEGA